MATAEKLDLRKVHRADYAAPKKPRRIDTTPGRYLAIQGRGAPGDETFQAAIDALYTVAYTMKWTFKMAKGRDYAVCCLECQYWSRKRDLSRVPKEEWNWKFLIRTPDFIREKDLAETQAACLEKGKTALVKKVKLESLEEGPVVQMLHVGPYDECGRTLEQMEVFARENDLSFRGRHHEIYISDPRRVPPERLKTIMRMPVKG